MRRLSGTLLLLLAPFASPAAAQERPAAITTEDVPDIPSSVVRALAPYRPVGGFAFGGWLGGRRELLIMAGGDPSGQVYSVVTPNAPPHRLTSIPGRPMGVECRPGSDEYVLSGDFDGDERVQLALLDPARASLKALTRVGTRNYSPRWSSDGTRLAFAGDLRNGSDLDLLLIDFRSDDRSPRLLRALEGLTNVEDWSSDSRQIVLTNSNVETGTTLIVVNAETKEHRVLLPTPAAPGIDGPGTPQWSPDGRRIVLTVHDGGNFRRLASLDVESGKVRMIGRPQPWDVEWFDLADDGRTLAVQSNVDGYSSLDVVNLDDGKSRHFDSLGSGQTSELAFRPGSTEVAMNFEGPSTPRQVVSVILGRGTTVPWTNYDDIRPRYRLPGDPRLVRFPSFDRLEIPAFVYLPTDPRFQSGKRPVLIDVHGGPQAQFRPTFLGRESFWVEELGMALIYPNVRGSTGYGIAFSHLDDGRKRLDSVRDIGALLDWIATQPNLDADRVIIRGGSYGGYMVLASLAEYGDRLRGGIDIAGVSNFVSLLEAGDPRIREIQRQEFGDERDPSMRAFLEDLAPVHRADRIRSPLLVVQGEQDPRVPVAEARQIVDAVRAHDVPVWYVLASNEGHGYSRGENLDYLISVEAAFIVQHLKKKP